MTDNYNQDNALQQTLSNFRNMVKSNNPKKPSMLDNILRSVSEILPRNAGAPTLSEGKANERLFRGINNPTLDSGLASYYDREARGMANAKVPSTFQPKTVQYSNEVTNNGKNNPVLFKQLYDKAFGTNSNVPLKTAPAVDISKIIAGQQPGLSNYQPPQAILGANTTIPNTAPTPTAVPTPVPGVYVNPQVEKFLTETVFPITRKYGLSDSMVAAQFAAEGRLGGAGAQRNNYFNLKFTDAKANSGDFSGLDYPTPQAGIEAYASFVTGQAQDSMYANGVDASKQNKIGKKQVQELFAKYKNDPQGFLKAISPMYSSGGVQYAANAMNTPEFRRFNY